MLQYPITAQPYVTSWKMSRGCINFYYVGHSIGKENALVTVRYNEKNRIKEECIELE